jgi:hypothetical protein
MAALKSRVQNRTATGRPSQPGAVSLVAATPLARIDIPLRHPGCGKQNLVYSAKHS